MDLGGGEKTQGVTYQENGRKILVFNLKTIPIWGCLIIQTKPKHIRLTNINDTIHLLVISDVHHAQEASDENRLVQDLKVKYSQRLILGLGDELDCISRADKRHDPANLKDRFFTKNTYSRLVDAEIEDYASILDIYTKPDEWLGHISGNHPMVMSEYGVDPIERLCIMLNHIYLGYSAFIPITIEYFGARISLMIMAHHGFGGTNARKEGSSVNAYIDHCMRYEGWDVAAYGHRHDRWIKTVPRIKPQQTIRTKPAWIRAIDRIVLQSGTYLRTLSHSKYPTYSEKAGYVPRPLGCLVLEIGIDRNQEEGKNNYSLKFIRSNV